MRQTAKPKIRVLIVDDDEVDSMAARRALAESPLAVSLAITAGGR